MRILFSAESYPSPHKPFAPFISDICHQMVISGNEVVVIAPQSLTAWLKWGEKLEKWKYVDKIETENGLKEIKVYKPYTLTFGCGRFIKLTTWFKKISVFLTAITLPRPDVCYAHFWSAGYSIFGYAKKKNIPLFVASGEDKIMLHAGLSARSLNSFRNYVRGVICVSTKNKTESVDCGLTSLDKCYVLPNSVNDKIFHPGPKAQIRKELGIKENDFVIAFSGRFYKRKGVTRVSDAIKRLNDEGIKTIFIGANTSDASDQPTCKGIIFKGLLPHKDVARYLNAADVFVLPTLAEGCSNSIVEAMACGLPIISSDLPFNYDILDNSNAILLDPLSIEEIASAIKKLKSNKSLLIDMGLNSLNKAKELTIEKRCGKIMSFIMNLMDI